MNKSIVCLFMFSNVTIGEPLIDQSMITDSLATSLSGSLFGDQLTINDNETNPISQLFAIKLTSIDADQLMTKVRSNYDWTKLSKTFFEEQLSMRCNNDSTADTLSMPTTNNSWQIGLKYSCDDIVTTMGYYNQSNLSGAVVNLHYQLTPLIRPYIGLQMPIDAIDNQIGGNIGLSIKLND